MTKLSIQVSVPCSLTGKAEVFYVTFNSPALVIDQDGNPLSTPSVNAKARGFAYMDETEKAVTESTGNAFKVLSMVTIAVVLASNAMTSVASGAFWAFMDMLQLISYLPLIDLELPSNMYLFLTKYMSANSLSIPFDMLPDWIPDPTKYFDYFSGVVLDSRYVSCGYESFSFMYNMSGNLSTWLLLLLFYLLLRVLSICSSEKHLAFIRRWRHEYEYNAVIRILIESYVSLCFASFLNIRNVPSHTKPSRLTEGQPPAKPRSSPPESVQYPLPALSR